MKLTLTLKMGNAAFDDSPAEEVARILHRFADDIRNHFLEEGDSYPLFDINGNKVGVVAIS